MKTRDCLIIGAGPGGGMTALTVASQGGDVLVLERKESVGWPVHCGEAVSTEAFRRCGLPLDPRWVVCEVKGARMIMPNGKAIRFHDQGVCIRRDRFDRWLLERAVGAGAELACRRRVEIAAREGDYWILRAGTTRYRGKILVMANGSVNAVAGITRLRRPLPVMFAAEYKFRKAPEPRSGYLHFYQGKFFQPGYGWIFDRGPEVSVGLGGPRKKLDTFCAMHGFDPKDRIASLTGYIPDRCPPRRFHSNGVVWVGDAAGLVHPLTRAGIHLALHSGRVAGESIVHALRSGDLRTLAAYQDTINNLLPPLRRQWRQFRWVRAVPDRVWNAIGDIMDERNFDALPFRNVPLFLLRHAWMVPWMLRFHDLQATYRTTMPFTW